MRRIKSREEIEKSKRKVKIIVGIALIGLMFLSTAGYAFFSGGSADSEKPNKNSNSQGNFIGGKWVYNIGNEQFAFKNYIGSSKNVPVDLNFSIYDYRDTPVFVVSDNFGVYNEISQNIGKYVLRIQEACYGSCDKDLPIKKCDENLIIYNESGENRVYQEGNCVFIEGDFVAVDAFLYKLLGFN